MQVQILFKIGILFLFTSLQANYCIQVMSTPINNKRTIIKKASNTIYQPFKLVRVEQRGNFLVFRIGNYINYQTAKTDLLKIKTLSRSAYIRKCDYIKEKTLYLQEKSTNTTPLKNSKLEKVKKSFQTNKSNKFGIDESLLP